MSHFEPLELHLTATTAEQPAIDLIAGAAALESTDLERCFCNGAVWLESRGKPRRLYDSRQVIPSGQQLHLYCNALTLAECPHRPDLVADFERFSVWNKPAGMLSQGSKWGDHWTMHRWIKANHWPDRGAYITHRLDRFTQGLMIVAHDAETNRHFHRLFEQRRIGKTYRAIVSGLADFDEVEIDQAIDGRPAQTRARALGRTPANRRSLVELYPATGRKHQVRRHLANIGLPIVNDRLYGRQPFEDDMQLQASALEFDHPDTGETLCIRLNDDKLLTLPNAEDLAP